MIRQIGYVVDGTYYCMDCADRQIAEYPDAQRTLVTASGGSFDCYACGQTIH